MNGDRENTKIVQKVWVNKNSGQKLITIPQNCDIEPGDYVEVIKF